MTATERAMCTEAEDRIRELEGWLRENKAEAVKAWTEVERLREALKHIAEADVELFTGKPQRPSGEYCVDAAKRALASDENCNDGETHG